MDPEGKTRLCCNASHGLRDIKDESGKAVYIQDIRSLEDFYNLPFFKKVRKAMLEGERPPACSPCYKMERFGSSSYREQFKKHWEKDLFRLFHATEKDGGLKKSSVQYMDLPLGNLCNLRCRMCHPSSSILMKKDFDYLKISYGGADRSGNG